MKYRPRVKHNLGSRLGRAYSQMRYRARVKGISFDLTCDEYQALMAPGCCTYCAGPLPRTGHGVDRVNNLQEYAADNVVACCGECNFRKGKLESAGFRGERAIELMKELRITHDI